MNEAVNLIREVGIYRLCGTDGCLCMNCEVRSIIVDISCRKSDSAMEKVKPDFYGIKIRLHSRSMDVGGEALKEVAEEVCRQIKDEGYAIAVRYCEFDFDRKQICVYCNKDRADPKGYLCEECLTKEQPYGGRISETYDYRKFEFEIAEPAEL